jgi:hypothetical protein
MVDARTAERVAVAEALGWAGMIVSGLEYAGLMIDAVVCLNEGELRRRGVSEPVLDRTLLRALMELPLGVEVPNDALGAEDRVALHLDGSEHVEWTPHGVRRLYQPPCDVIGITTTSEHLPRAINEIASLSGFALRAVHGRRRTCTTASEQAAQLGVGLVATDGEAAVVLTRPERRGIRPSPSRWRFCELLYERSSKGFSESTATL